jgi:hypothetical protein
MHMLYVPHGGVDMREACYRATTMMMTMVQTHVSVVLRSSEDEAEVEGAILKAQEDTVGHLGQMPGLLDAMQKGLPLTRARFNVPECEGLDERQTQADIARGTQTVLLPNAGQPGAKVAGSYCGPAVTRGSGKQVVQDAAKQEEAALRLAAGVAAAKRKQTLQEALKNTDPPAKKPKTLGVRVGTKGRGKGSPNKDGGSASSTSQ